MPNGSSEKKLHWLLILMLLGCSAPLDPPVVMAVVYAGQSNATSIATDSIPDGIPTDAVPYWPFVINKIEAKEWQPLAPLSDGTHGAEEALGLALWGAGRKVAILKVSRNGSAIAQWVEGGPYREILNTQVRAYAVAVAERFPNHSLSWQFIWDQGEQEAKAASAAGSSAWASNFALLIADVRSACGCSPTEYIVRTNLDVAGARHVLQVRAAQAASSSRIIDQDGLPTIDGTHRTGASQNIVGARLADIAMTQAHLLSCCGAVK